MALNLQQNNEESSQSYAEHCEIKRSWYTCENVIKIALHLPNIDQITDLEGITPSDSDVIQAIAKIPISQSGVGKKTVAHMIFAHKKGLNPLESVCEIIQPQFGDSMRFDSTHKNEFSDEMDKHAKLYEVRRDFMIDELFSRCCDIYGDQLGSITLPQSVQMVKWGWDRHGTEEGPYFAIQHQYVSTYHKLAYIIDHMTTMQMMFIRLKICAKLIYARNSIFRRKTKTYQLLYSSGKQQRIKEFIGNLRATHVNKVVQINESLLYYVRKICSELLDDLKNGARLGIVSKNPYFDPLTIVHSISLMISWIPSYLKEELPKNQTHTTGEHKTGQLSPRTTKHTEEDDEIFCQFEKYIPTTVSSDKFDPYFSENLFGIEFDQNRSNNSYEEWHISEDSPYTSEEKCPFVAQNISDWKTLL